jgi:hypothetical protein
MAAQLQEGMLGTPLAFGQTLGFVSAKISLLTEAPVVTYIIKSCRSRNVDAQRERLAQTTLWTSNTEARYMGRRTAVAWGSIAAHNLATYAYSQSELGFVPPTSTYIIYPGVQLPAPNRSLGHTRGQVTCAMARWKALINAVMLVYAGISDGECSCKRISQP